MQQCGRRAGVGDLAQQVVLGVALTVLTTIFIVWAAGKIVRTGLLMQGKGVTLSELFRWVKA